MNMPERRHLVGTPVSVDVSNAGSEKKTFVEVLKTVRDKRRARNEKNRQRIMAENRKRELNGSKK